MIVLEQLQNFSIGEWLATIFSVAYIIYAVQNKTICFVYGLIASICWAYVSYFEYNLLFDGILQLFYAAMSIWGIFQWRAGKAEESPLPITRMTTKDHLLFIVFGVVVSLILAFVADHYLDIDKSVADSMTTGFSIIATYLLILRKLQNWLYFIICDLVYALYIYPSQGAYLFAIIMIIFTIMAIIGYSKWQKSL